MMTTLVTYTFLAYSAIALFDFLPALLTLPLKSVSLAE